MSWRRSSGEGDACDSNTIANGNFIGSGSLTCQYGCSTTITEMLYVCTDFSIVEDWSFGERRLNYNQ